MASGVKQVLVQLEGRISGLQRQKNHQGLRGKQAGSCPESGHRTGQGQAKSARQGQRLSVAAVFAIADELAGPT